MENKGRSSEVFLLIIALYAWYAVLFIQNTSFTVDGVKYYCLSDDAMISMRYARNLAEGGGLVWNAGGERVEGYSDFLWVLWMAALHLLPVPIETLSLLVQLSELLLVAASLYLIRRIALKTTGSDLIALGAVALTAFYYPLNNWALQGSDAGPVLFVLCLAVLEALACLENNILSFRLLAILGLGTLVRIDFTALFLAIPLYLILKQKTGRRASAGLFLLAALIFLGGQTLFRLWYYGDVLPNTYYLKIGGTPVAVRMLRGFSTTLDFIKDLSLPVFLLSLYAVITRRRDGKIAFITFVFAAQLCYNLLAGGDAWEWYGGANRYIAVVMPLFFTLTATAIYDIILAISKKNAPEKYFKLSFAAFTLLLLVAVHGSSRPRIQELLLLSPPPPISDYENRNSVWTAKIIGETTMENATVAVVRAGAIPYFTMRYSIDMLGKNDPHIAHEKPRYGSTIGDYQKFQPGHTKCDGNYSIITLRPDVIAGLWCDQDGLAPYLSEHYTTVRDMYFRKGAGNVNWTAVDRLKDAVIL
jgi:arabinofuranosyltransferase